MRGRIAFAWILIAAVILLAACTPDTDSTDLESVQTATVEPTPAPTETPEPVTRQDFPSLFAPGLNDIGIIPEGTYKIGVIAGLYDADVWEELNAICSEYEENLDIEILTALCAGVQTQIDTAEDMILEGVDFLILSPNDSAALSEVGDFCKTQDVPYITINDSIDKTPGEEGYICTIEQDDYMIGIMTGIAIVEEMVEKYGEPMGNIGEITGTVSDEASILRSMGIRRVFAEFEDLNVVCCVAGDYDDDTSYKAAVNVLKAFREGGLDGIITVDDDTGLQALQAVLDYDRNEMVGCIWSAGGTKSGLTCVWHGDFAQTIECTSQTGMAALEYALQYLEGEGGDIPPGVATLTRAFRADTSEQSDAIAEIIAKMVEYETDFCFENIGEYDLFLPETTLLEAFYPLHYYEYDDVDAYLSEYEPYTTGDAIYIIQEITE